MQIHKRKIGILFAIPILFAAILPIGLYAWRQSTRRTAPEGNAAFVLALDEVDEALLSHLHTGDRVVDRQSRRILGDIAEIRSSQSMREVYSEAHGALVQAPVPERLQILLTLRATERDGTVLTENGDTVRLGQTYYFRTYDFSGEGRVVALS